MPGRRGARAPRSRPRSRFPQHDARSLNGSITRRWRRTMRHFAHLGLSAAATMAALVCASPASAAAPAPGSGGHSPNSAREEVFELVARSTQASSIDVNPSGSSQGDQLVVSGDLLRNSAVVGSFNEVCTLTRNDLATDTGTEQCQVTLTLPDGHITVQGAPPRPAPATSRSRSPEARGAIGRLTASSTPSMAIMRTPRSPSTSSADHGRRPDQSHSSSASRSISSASCQVPSAPRS
jgi:hypothetical protein